ncbi:hypothetical protein LshimejAT787_0304470 [Lyophyllum shimeji]|uniref:Uncharacterized protein n=1 Tax=Lyophyllum shimeji TaxID=47721 RepID=A0A9P3UIX2_LYOSH|nr:hypothetical protein LshimejAT787_0304470 [Lyophyllum shimeji]
MDFVQSLDPSKLVLAETILSFALSAFTAPPYNLPVFLFGTYAQENTEAVHSLQTFTGLLGASTLFDLVWMTRHEQNGFVRLLTIVILILKIPTFFAFGAALRQRGTHFGGLGGSDISGPTVWSMPGGFTSGGREGYQTVDEERPNPPSRPPAAGPPPPPDHKRPDQGSYQQV